MAPRVTQLLVGIGFLASAALALSLRAPQQPADISSVTSAEASDLVLGAWKSDQDGAYGVRFGEDGALAETYDGETVAEGTYRFAASPAGYADAGPETPETEAGTYLLEDLDGERFAYRVLRLTPSSLELSYLERGNTLSFSRP